MKWIKKNVINIILILILLTGIGLLLYPTLADYWNNMHQTKAIASYEQQIDRMDTETFEEMFAAADAFNREQRNWGWQLTNAQREEYNSVLDVTGTGIMGYIDIEKIHVSLPIYHGTDEAVLQVAVGHLEGSSLPVGGESTHCVLSGHRGLPSSRLFTDLDKIEIGDTFTITVLDQVLTYEVDQIEVVLPTNSQYLQIDEGEDYVTLITCTPYGINSHRLLVRGRRIDTPEERSHVRVTADAVRIEPILMAPFVAAVLLVLFVGRLLFSDKKRKKRKGGTGCRP